MRDLEVPLPVDDDAVRGALIARLRTHQHVDAHRLAAAEAAAQEARAQEVTLQSLPYPSCRRLRSSLTDMTEEGREGCQSIPGMRGSVPRATHIRHREIAGHGGELAREAWGFHARIVQHEFDHLNGVLYPQRIADMMKFGFVDALFPHSAVTALEAE